MKYATPIFQERRFLPEMRYPNFIFGVKSAYIGGRFGNIQ